MGYSPGGRDIRLQRERIHRRIVVGMVRRFVRVVALHFLDGGLIVGLVLLLAGVGPGLGTVQEFAPVIAAIFLASLNAMSCYQPGDARRDWRRLASAVLMAVLILFFLTVFAPRLPLSPSFLAGLGISAYLGLMVGRKLVDLAVRQVYRHGFGLRRAVLIGTLDEVGHAIHQLRDNRNVDQYLVGHLAPENRPDPTALGTLADLPQILEQQSVQEVIIAARLSQEEMFAISDCCFEQGVALYMFPAVLGPLQCGSEPQRFGSCVLLHLFPDRFELPTFFLKRAFDLVGSVLLLILLAPLMLVIAAAVRWDSPGPVFFRQERVGLGGRRFTMWKFRSMFVNADQAKERLAHLNSYADPRLFKLENDPRITRVGRLLRRTSLDELPQLINVLLGQMSLVGPRPPLPSEVARYEPHHLVRLAVMPGMTGPWQVNGRNLITDFETVVQLERGYIQGWSLGLDIKILLRTVSVVVRGEGAY